MNKQVLSITLTVGLAAGGAALRADDIWGENRGCLQVTATRQTPLAQRGRATAPTDADTPFRLRFRFRTLGPHSYAALLFIGVHGRDADFSSNGAGVILHRHSAEKGLRAYAFVADSHGTLHTSKEEQAEIEYDTVYDADGTYTPVDRTLRVTFRDVFRDTPAATSALRVPADVTWRSDCLALWNYADGLAKVANSSRLTALVDSLTLNDQPPLQFDRDLTELPLDAGGDAFAWTRVPLPPLFGALTGPGRVEPGEAASFRAVLRQGTTGTVRFDLRTFTGEVLLQQEATVQDAVAAATFPASGLDPLTRGEHAVTVTLTGRPDRIARSLLLRGRAFRNLGTAPSDLRPGDELVFDDMTAFGPKAAVSDTSRKGQWWRRPYRCEGGDEVRHMLCVEEHDPRAPHSCLAPPLRLPLKLDGWYEVWVTTYRAETGGGIDVRLSGEPYFLHLDPQQIDTSSSYRWEPRLVDVRFRSADLSGQDLVFQQPYGTYDSANKLCNAAVAGVRLIRLSAEQVARLRAEAVDTASRVTGFDNDGYSYFWRWGTHERACIARLLEPLRTPSAAFLHLSLGGLGGLTIPTPYTELFQLHGHVRDGDVRANAFFRWCSEAKVNIVNVLTERAHELGLKLFVATMMERSFSRDRFMQEHPDWRIRRGRGNWDYAKDEVHAFQIRKIAWICANHDIDGFTLDFTRYGHYFNEDEANKAEHMNRFVRALRREIDRVNATKARRVALGASFGEESLFMRHWGTATLSDQGLDPATWIREELFDILMPEGKTCLQFVRMARDSRTQVWPRKVTGYALPADEPVGGKLGPTGIERCVQQAFDAGAPGIFFFNHEIWTTLGRLGVRGELDLRAATDTSYGLREGTPVQFADWLPRFGDCEKLRQSFSPVTVEAGAGQVDATATLPLRNRFERAVTAQVRWTVLADDAALHVTPATPQRELEPGAAAVFEARVQGTFPAARGAATLAADIDYVADGITVFRARVPVRLVPELACAGAPAVMPAVVLGEASALRVERTPEALRITTELPAAPADTAPLARDDFRGLRKRPCVTLLIGPGRSEQTFYAFLTDGSGSRAEAHWSYSAFHNKHLMKPEWNGDWAAARDGGGGGARVTLTVPFATVGAAPEPGSCWRLAVSVRGAGTAVQWPPGNDGDIACFGRLVFE